MANAPRPVIAYFPAWSGKPDDVEWRNITHLNYSFVLPTADGGLTEEDGKLLTALVREGRKHGVKIGMAIGGWNDGDCTAFERMAADPEARARFVRAATALCDTYGLDGIDIDWEYPKAHSAVDFSRLMAALHDALRPKGRFLSTAVIAEGDEFGRFVGNDVFSHVDFLNIMAYDWHYQVEGNHHSSYDVAEKSLAYWRDRGCPREKAILGVPFYGRSAKEALSYKELVAREPEAPGRDDVGGILYNGLATMRRKTELALREGGGIMFWEITQDTRDESSSLLSAIAATVRRVAAPQA